MELESLNKDRKRKKTAIDTTLLIAKVPPQCREVEETLLGIILLTGRSIELVEPILKPHHFYVEANQIIYASMISLFSRHVFVETLSVFTDLKEKEQLDNIGGQYRLIELTKNVVTYDNLEHYAQKIIETFKKREVIRISSKFIGEAYEESAPANELIDEMNKEIDQINSSTKVVSGVEMINNLGDFLNVLEDRINKAKNGEIQGITSGFREIDELTNGWQKTDLITIAAMSSVGKCLGKGTPVLMYDGSIKPVEEIQVGDLVMGDDSTPRTVLNTVIGVEQMYWIRQLKGMDYRVNESHILSLENYKGGVWNVSVIDYLKESSRHNRDYFGYKRCIHFPKKELPLDPYILGLWIGDGSSSSNRITNPDIEIVNSLKDFAINNGMRVYVDSPKNGKCQSIAVGGINRNLNSPKLKTILKKMNLLNNKHIPKDYLINSVENRLQLLAGLLDTDGYLTNSNYEISQKNNQIAESIIFLANTLGFRTHHKIKYVNGVPYNRIGISGEIYKIPLRVKRKIATWDHKRRGANNRMKITVEKDIVDYYYGFELDGNKLFVLGDGTITHNTAFGLNLTRNAAMNGIPVAFFTREMSKQQLMERLIAMESKVELGKIKSGRLDDELKKQILSKGIKNLETAPLYIIPASGMTWMDVRRTARQLKRKYGVQMIVDDYIQIGKDIDTKGKNREQIIATISGENKITAQELDIAFIQLSQVLGKEIAKRDNKVPTMQDVRESEAITNDSNIVMMLYRPEYHGLFHGESGESLAGKTFVKFVKFRDGQLGKQVELRSNLAIQKFFSPDENVEIYKGSEQGFIFNPSTANQQFDEGIKAEDEFSFIKK